MHLTGRPVAHVPRRFRLRPTPVAEKRARERGQALVEFALVAMPLFLVLFGIIQLGILFGSQQGLINAVRDEARYASTVITSSAADATTNAPVACADLKNRLAQYVPAFSNANLATTGARARIGYYLYQVPNQTPTHYAVRVVADVQYGQPLLLPIVGQLLDPFDGVTDNRLRIGAREEMRVEGQIVDKPTGLDTTVWTSC
jgi:Flp pilus assembly protein TadG